MATSRAKRSRTRARAETEVYVHGRALGREQPAPFFRIGRRAFAGEAG